MGPHGGVFPLSFPEYWEVPSQGRFRGGKLLLFSCLFTCDEQCQLCAEGLVSGRKGTTPVRLLSVVCAYAVFFYVLQHVFKIKVEIFSIKRLLGGLSTLGIILPVGKLFT